MSPNARPVSMPSISPGPLRSDLACILDSMGEGLIVTDRTGRVSILNPVAEELTGWSSAEAAGQMLEQVFWLDDSAEAEGLRADGGLAFGQSLRGVLLSRSGVRRPILASCAPVRDGGGSRGAVIVLRDQTREEAERRSLHEAAKFQMELDCAPSTIVRLDSAGVVTHVNAAWRRFAADNDAPSSLMAGLGMSYLEACRDGSDPDVRRVRELLLELLGGRRASFELTYACHSPRTLRWFRLEARSLGEGAGAVLIHSDTTSYRLAEARLSIQTLVTSALADRRPVLDACAAVLQEVSAGLEFPVAAVWLPGPRGSLRASSIVTSPRMAGQPIVEAMGVGSRIVDAELPCLAAADGSPRWLLDLAEARPCPRYEAARASGLRTVVAVPLVFDGQVLAVLELFSVVARDPEVELIDLLTTAGLQLGASALRARAELAETNAEETRIRFDAVLDHAPAWIVAIDRAGRVEFVNRGMPGLDGELAIGCPWVDVFPPSERVRLSQEIEVALAECRATNFEVSLSDGEGPPRSLSCHVGPMLRGSEHLGAVIIAQDVTELRNTQAEYAASQRLAAVGTLAAGVAHEINTPVQFVSDSLYFLRDAAKDVLPLLARYRGLERLVQEGRSLGAELEELAHVAEEIDLDYVVENVPKAFDRCTDGLQRVATIVRSMKEFAHPSAKEMAPADLNRAIESTLTVARNEYKYVAELDVDFGPIPPVTCYLSEINQVVLNLVVNAAHAIADVVQGTEEKGRISVSTAREGDFVAIRVEDTGGGIPESIRHRVFEPFFTTKPVGKGTGQGLSLAWAVVREKHGGEIGFESSLGRGTTFTIRLPIAGKSSTHDREATP